MENLLQEIRGRVMTSIENAKATLELEQIRVSVLGKKGELTAILRGMGKMCIRDRYSRCC